MALFSNYTMQGTEERKKTNLVKRAPAVFSHVVVGLTFGSIWWSSESFFLHQKLHAVFFLHACLFYKLQNLILSSVKSRKLYRAK